ncbi:hypothetical protein RHOFW104T7_10790 [Rhodanobacter thiooxydans]|uniref:Uncharacterized protein n=2 Tax=Rhodanobacter thiooxydans TaxID=416169 RepID=A0A154QJI8_9GAMM|nr:hypothetical protein RHOFW104T7_10790 [Rhodanobacter thiooxydans]
MLKLSLSLANDAHPDIELRVSTNDTPCDVVITLPSARAGTSRASSGEPSSAEDAAFGAYAGI